MRMSKATFPLIEGGFDLCLPSKRTEVAIVALFFHSLQNSPILRSLIISELSLSLPSQSFQSGYLVTSSSWIWLRTAVRIINEIDLVPNLQNNSLMWASR
eukprot:TRINITY_DN10099_c0_g2_i1.p3 TRINITY_DN10099_c0_g2~~TRINITY_DN10099_c0_g2_i1.p3  ORF type:complete len:100 (-),score=8.28 TRINITY_DN10099_c0_g2_i1:641-940(-)